MVVLLGASHPALSLPPVVLIPTGMTSATFAVGVGDVDSGQTVTLTARSVNSVSISLTLEPAPTLKEVTLAAGSVVGGQPATATLVLSGPAGVSGFVVDLTSSSTSMNVPGAVTVPPGAASVNFQIATSPVTEMEFGVVMAAGESAVLAIQPFSARVVNPGPPIVIVD